MNRLAALAAFALVIGHPTSGALASPSDNSLVIGATAEPAALAPFGNDTPIGREVAGWLYRDLTYVDLQGRPQPDLAAELPTEENGRVTISRNGAGEPTSMRVRWTLREGLRWSDGRPLTSEDLRFTYELLADERFLASSRASLPTGVAVIDPLTVELTYEPILLAYALGTGRFGHYPAPAHVFGPLLERARAGAANRTLEAARELYRQTLFAPVSGGRGPTATSGPFAFQNWRPGQTMGFARSAGYWQPNPSGVERVTYRFFGGAAPLESALLAGLVDAASSVGLPATPEVLRRLSAARTVAVFPVSGGGWAGLGVGGGELLLDDPRTRRAFALAIDRGRLAREALAGLGRPTISPLSRDSAAYSELPAPTLAPNPERARQILAGLGWRPGADGVLERDIEGRSVRFSLEYAVAEGDAPGEATRRFVTEALRAVGVEVVPVTVPSLEDLRARAAAGDWQGLIALGGNGDPLLGVGEEFRCGPASPAGETAALSPAGGTCSADFDRFLGLAEGATDAAKRRAFLAQAQATFARDLPVIPLVERLEIVVARRGLTNYVYNGPTRSPSQLGWLVGWGQRGQAEVVRPPAP